MTLGQSAEAIEMELSISAIFMMVFAFCGWLAYQGVAQGEYAATLVGICGGAGIGLILLAELQDNPTKFVMALVVVITSIVISYPIAYEIAHEMV